MELASSVCSKAPIVAGIAAQVELSEFAYAYLLKSLGLPKPEDRRCRPSIDELNRVLWENLDREQG
jgi:hypothetical protein